MVEKIVPRRIDLTSTQNAEVYFHISHSNPMYYSVVEKIAQENDFTLTTVLEDMYTGSLLTRLH